MLNETFDYQSGTPVEKSIHYFSSRNDTSFMYVLHDMESGLVIYCKDQTQLTKSKYENDEWISMYKAAVEIW